MHFNVTPLSPMIVKQKFLTIKLRLRCVVIAYSLIEKQLKIHEVYFPVEYTPITREARNDSFLFEIHFVFLVTFQIPNTNGTIQSNLELPNLWIKCTSYSIVFSLRVISNTFLFHSGKKCYRYKGKRNIQNFYILQVRGISLLFFFGTGKVCC